MWKVIALHVDSTHIVIAKTYIWNKHMYLRALQRFQPGVFAKFRDANIARVVWWNFQNAACKSTHWFSSRTWNINRSFGLMLHIFNITKKGRGTPSRCSHIYAKICFAPRICFSIALQYSHNKHINLSTRSEGPRLSVRATRKHCSNMMWRNKNTCRQSCHTLV